MQNPVKVLFVSLSLGRLLSPCCEAQHYEWSLFAGSPTGPGVADGPVAGALCNAANGAVVDSGGNLLIADSQNHTVRKVTPAGVVSTIAGFPEVSGISDGTGTEARFKFPAALTFDAGGNLYVADQQNHTIRKVSPAGVVSTLAGMPGTSGTADGAGSVARFNNPAGVAVDAAGNVFVADQSSHTIRKITPAGVVTTFAGVAGMTGSTNGTGTAARFNRPAGIVMAADGSFYITDSSNFVIRRMTAGGDVTVFAGAAGQSGAVDATGSAARFGSVHGITRDGSGNFYVTVTNSNTVRKITAGAVVTTLAGGAGSSGFVDGTGTAARFNMPTGIAAESGGTVYVTDTANFAVRRITATGVTTTLFGGPLRSGNTNGQGAAARFNRPGPMAIDSSGNLYVVEPQNYTLRKITPSGVVSTLAGSPGIASPVDGTGSAARFVNPTGVTVNGDGIIFVSDGEGDIIRRVSPTGVVTTVAGSSTMNGSADGTGTAARFNHPNGLVFDSTGNLYIADGSNATIRRMTAAFAVTTVAGTPLSPGAVDGTGSAARFRFPNGLAMLPGGDIVVADYQNNAVRRMTSAGVVTTMAGKPGVLGSIDGLVSEATFGRPHSVTVDAGGRVLVLDDDQATVRMIATDGTVSTIGGVGGLPGMGGGSGITVRFDTPRGIAVNSQGVVFVSDLLNHRIMKGVFTVPDTMTLPPVLTGPADNSVHGITVPVLFTLPEAAKAGTVKLTFAGAASRVITLSLETTATHGLQINTASVAGSPGVVSVSGGTDLPRGTYAVTLSYQDVAGNTAASDVSENVVISPLGAWKLTNTGSATTADTADLDSDGVSVLEEYAWGLNPSVPDKSPVTVAAHSYPDGRRLRVLVPRDPARAEAGIYVEGSDSAGGPWVTLASSVNGAPFSGPGYVSGDGPGTGVRTVEVRDVVADAGRRFVRVRVQ